MAYTRGMGLLQGAIERAYNHAKDSIYKEAAAISSTVFGFEQFTAQSTSMGALMGGALKDKVKDQLLGPLAGFTGGGDDVADGYQIYGIETAGVRHLYVQPFAQSLALAGEHHAWVPGSLRSPIAYRHARVLWGWSAGGDAELEQWLSSQGALTVTAKQLERTWKSGNQTWDLDWTMQLVSMGDGRSHLCMQAGSYGGLLAGMNVGLGQLMSLGSLVGPVLTNNAYPAQSPLHPVAFTHLFQQYILNAPQSAPVQASPQADFSQVILQTAGPFGGESFFVGQLPGEIEANVRALILPAHQKQARVCVVLDLTAFGSAKDAVVITSDYVFIRELGETQGFSLTDLASVDPPKGMINKTVQVHLRSGRKIKVPGANGDDARGAFAVLSAVCATL